MIRENQVKQMVKQVHRFKGSKVQSSAILKLVLFECTAKCSLKVYFKCQLPNGQMSDKQTKKQK